jgi:hypothetical protein
MQGVMMMMMMMMMNSGFYVQSLRTVPADQLFSLYLLGF